MAFLDKIKDNMRLPGEVGVMADGTAIRMSFGPNGTVGASMVRIPSRAAIVRMMQGHQQYFVNNHSAVVPWTLAYPATGHAATNSALFFRRSFCQVLKEDWTWEWAWVNRPVWGKRVWRANDSSGRVPGTQTRLADGVLRVVPSNQVAGDNWGAGSYGYELWPDSWDGQFGNVQDFFGKVDKALFQQARCVCMGTQVKIGLIDPNGTNDLASARLCAKVGNDPYVSPYPGKRSINDDGTATSDSNGPGWFPYGAADGDFMRWRLITNTDWDWLTCIGVAYLWGHEADLNPPYGSGGPAKMPWNKPPYAITEAELDAHPPMEPPGDNTPAPAPAPGPAPTPVPPPSPPPTSPPAIAFADSVYRTRAAADVIYVDRLTPAPTPPPAPGDAGIRSISASPASIVFTAEGQTQQINLTFDADVGADTSVTYTLTGTGATVGSGGLVTAAAGVGSSVVLITSVADPTITATVTVIRTDGVVDNTSTLLDRTRLPFRKNQTKG